MRFCTVSILVQKASMHLPYILFMCIFLFLIIGMGEPLRIGQTPAAHAPGAQILEGKGQAKRTRMKRKMSEHASSIGSDEQNLDIPKRLKSSEQCAVPGVSWQNKKRAWQVLWYEEKERKWKHFSAHSLFESKRHASFFVHACCPLRVLN